MPYYPTEDLTILKKALKNIFPDLKIQHDPSGCTFTGKGKSIVEFGELLKRHRIRDTARSILLRGIEGNTTRFKLNKQTAVVGKINFVGIREPQVLGEIDVELSHNNLDELIDEIAPLTKIESKPVSSALDEE